LTIYINLKKKSRFSAKIPYYSLKHPHVENTWLHHFINRGGFGAIQLAYQRQLLLKCLYQARNTVMYTSAKGIHFPSFSTILRADYRTVNFIDDKKNPISNMIVWYY